MDLAVFYRGMAHGSRAHPAPHHRTGRDTAAASAAAHAPIAVLSRMVDPSVAVSGGLIIVVDAVVVFAVAVAVSVAVAIAIAIAV